MLAVKPSLREPHEIERLHKVGACDGWVKFNGPSERQAPRRRLDRMRVDIHLANRAVGEADRRGDNAVAGLVE